MDLLSRCIHTVSEFPLKALKYHVHLQFCVSVVSVRETGAEINTVHTQTSLPSHSPQCTYVSECVCTGIHEEKAGREQTAISAVVILRGRIMDD